MMKNIIIYILIIIQIVACGQNTRKNVKIYNSDILKDIEGGVFNGIYNTDIDSVCGYTDTIYINISGNTKPIIFFVDCYYYEGGLIQIPKEHQFNKSSNYIRVGTKNYLFEGMLYDKSEEIIDVISKDSLSSKILALDFGKEMWGLFDFLSKYVELNEEYELVLYMKNKLFWDGQPAPPSTSK
jgi:hypothetical protein